MNVNDYFKDGRSETEAKLLEVTVSQPTLHIYSDVEALTDTITSHHRSHPRHHPPSAL